YEKKEKGIKATIKHYFSGIYQGDVQLLQSAFADTAYLYGDIKGAEYAKSLGEYLEGVQNRKSPEESGEGFQMDILSIEIIGKVAIAKVRVPMLGYNYYDFLSLSLINDQWKIVNKVFTHVE